jgi:hypothetical protein
VFCVSTSSSGGHRQGPFRLRGMTGAPTASSLRRRGDHRVAGLAGLAGPAFRLAPTGDRVSTARVLPRRRPVVIDRVHGHAADLRVAALPLAAVTFAGLMLPCSALPTPPPWPAVPSTRRISPDGMRSWACGPSWRGAARRPGRPSDLGPAARAQLMAHHGAGGDAVRGRRCRTDARGCPLHPVAWRRPWGARCVPLLPVGVVQQRDPGGPVRVVLDVRDLADAVLVRPESRSAGRASLCRPGAGW